MLKCKFKNNTAIISFAIIISTCLVSCNDFGNKENPLFEKEFKNIKDIPELKNYTFYGGSVIDFSKDKNGDYKFGIGHYENNENHICILEEFLERDQKGKPTYKILDTLFVGKLREQEYLSYCNCRKDSTWDYEIISLVIAEDEKNFFDKVVKAWRADTKTGKIRALENTSGINCLNEGYGLEGCGGDEDFDSVEVYSAPSIDSINPNLDTFLNDSTKIDTNFNTP